VILEYFSKPLSVLGWVNPQDSAQIFGNIAEIYAGNSKLLAEMSEVVDAWNVDSTLGDIFARNIDLLTPHLAYVQNFYSSSETLNKCLAQDKEKSDKSGSLHIFLQVGVYPPA
jgi:hypothetical protein